MERSKTCYGFLSTIVGNADAIEDEKKRLDAIIAAVGGRIRKRLTPKTVPGLLWYLALKELERIAPLESSSDVTAPLNWLPGKEL